MSQDRMVRVNRLLQTILAELTTQVRDPRVSALPFLSVTAVRTSPDLRQARVYLSIPAEPAVQRAALEAMSGARGFLRARLGQRIELRRTPELSFLLDESLDKAARIEQVLHEIHAEAERGPGGEGEEEDA